MKEQLRLSSWWCSALTVVLTAQGCAEDRAADVPGSRFEITVAPLDGAIAKACYKVDVFNTTSPASFDAEHLVWEQATLCSGTGAGPQFGVGGELRYVGTCDASAGDGTLNSVRLTIMSLADASDHSLLDEGAINPCPSATGEAPDNGCVIQAPCSASEDTPVEFDITLMVMGSIGFFDIAVRVDEVFCAAKLDCLNDEGTTLEFLQKANGEDGPTAVLGFACLGIDGGDITMYLDDITVTCTSGSATIDPSGGPGYLAFPALTQVNPPPLFAAAVNKGEASQGSLYWNVQLGLNLAAANGACTLHALGTVSDTPLSGPPFQTPADTRYPYIEWDVPLSNGVTGQCTRHPLNGGQVQTKYTGIQTGKSFKYDHAPACTCPDGYAPNVTNEVCVQELTAEPIPNLVQWSVCAAAYNEAYSMWGARFHSSFSPGANEGLNGPSICNDSSTCVEVQSPYSDFPLFQVRYLSDVGVWACEGNTNTTGAEPTQQWIGFSRCIDIDQAGDYLVGIAGDNHVLLRLDGATIYQSTQSLNFRSWNVFKLHVTAGTHILELFGKNDTNAAAFGAEISGPFDVGAIDTPTQMSVADYQNNIVFSTRNLRGQSGLTFDTSLNASVPSGTTCPVGYALAQCEEPSVCRLHTEVACGTQTP